MQKTYKSEAQIKVQNHNCFCLTNTHFFCHQQQQHFSVELFIANGWGILMLPEGKLMAAVKSGKVDFVSWWS